MDAKIFRIRDIFDVLLPRDYPSVGEELSVNGNEYNKQ